MTASTVDTDGPRVLVVDDNPAIRASAETHLQAHGWTVLFASDGFEALSSIVTFRPEAIFVDTLMPRLDGYQMCALVKSNPDFQDIPVIMIANSEYGIDEERARLVGCEAHIAKPFTAATLLGAVNKYCHSETHS